MAPFRDRVEDSRVRTNGSTSSSIHNACSTHRIRHVAGNVLTFLLEYILKTKNSHANNAVQMTTALSDHPSYSPSRRPAECLVSACRRFGRLRDRPLSHWIATNLIIEQQKLDVHIRFGR